MIDDVMMMSTPALWPGPVCCVKRNTDCVSMENFGYLKFNHRGKVIPVVHTEVGVSFHYDTFEELISAGWIVD